eukprot:NODE_311_length_2476_cov_31.088999_g288_i0.p1 GENE.NODE_311_length_2476_cov_31.088999_g288_i0~~NODE_311_length_2476_cov_31.088999_g288_i0.p1  ORF type:complete len:469 (+),score=80.22 NODE_311_length_2476_cov_31.088999_g288_i0:805-2211(+)
MEAQRTWRLEQQQKEEAQQREQQKAEKLRLAEEKERLKEAAALKYAEQMKQQRRAEQEREKLKIRDGMRGLDLESMSVSAAFASSRPRTSTPRAIDARMMPTADANGVVGYFPTHPDPAPHLLKGSQQPAPGPRVNKKPPAPAQPPPGRGMAMIPPPQGPQIMTFRLPPLTSGQHMSPPEGERATKHSFNVQTQQWTKAPIRVRIDEYPFQEGTLRCVFYMKDFSKPAGSLQDYVAKISKNVNEKEESYFQDCEMQSLASQCACEFNRRKPPKCVSYLKASVLELHDRVPRTPGGRVLIGVEPYVHGKFAKYTNNYGWVNPGAPRETPQAFSHFSYEYFGGTKMIVDVQGITDGQQVDRYTDPQILTNAPVAQFGKADLRSEGIKQFFATHRCNSVCQALGLSTHNEFTSGVQQNAGMSSPSRGYSLPASPYGPSAPLMVGSPGFGGYRAMLPPHGHGLLQSAAVPFY